MTQTPMSIEERFEKLEKDLHRARRRNRWLLAAVCACIGLGGAEWMSRPYPLLAPKEVRAEGFVLVDAKGTVRAVLGTIPDGTTALTLGDVEGKARASLGLDTNGAPALRLSDANGASRATLGVSQTTTKDGTVTTFPESSLLLFDPDGTVRWKTP
jgi:hypothetical protein